MRYKIILSYNSINDLDKIFEYIAYVLQVPKSAKKIVNNITDRIFDLETSPEKYMVYPDEPFKSQELRYFIEGKYYIFYKVDNDAKIVSIRRIIYTGRYLGSLSI